jgi:cytochrome c55X
VSHAVPVFKLGALLLGSSLVACSATQAQSGAQPSGAAPPAAPAEASVAAGRKLYGSYCARCHGVNMVSIGSGFYDLRTFPADQKERFVQSVNKGIRAMPAWEGTLKSEEVSDLWAYVLSGQK